MDQSEFEFINKIANADKRFLIDALLALNSDETYAVSSISRKDYLSQFLPEKREEIALVLGLLGNAYFSLISVNATIMEMDRSRRMARRYPWHGTDITKAEHLDFVWRAFLNQCYCFEERVKQSSNHINKISTIFDFPKIDTGKWVKRATKSLSAFIQLRGMHVHQWPQTHESYKFFSLLETAGIIDNQFHEAASTLYPIVKSYTQDEMSNGIKAARKFFVEYESEFSPKLLMSLDLAKQYLDTNNIRQSKDLTTN